LTKSRYDEILIRKYLVFPYLKQPWRRWRWQTPRRHTFEYKYVSLPWWHAQMYYWSGSHYLIYTIAITDLKGNARARTNLHEKYKNKNKRGFSV